MSTEEQAEFLQELARALNAKDVALPSFPDVVIQIRTALEDPTCTPDRLAEVAKMDPVLVSRLLMSANSAFHNRAGIEIVDLNLAISRLGFEAVKNTAIALAVEQLFNASKHKDLREKLKELWSRSISLSSMCYVLAVRAANVNSDNAFLCGLLHEVGKLYILTKAKDYPSFLGDSDTLDAVMTQWNPQVGKSIVESWGFSAEIAESCDADVPMDANASQAAALVDVVCAANAILDDENAALESDPLHPSITRLGVSMESLPDIKESFELHAQSMRQAIST